MGARVASHGVRAGARVWARRFAPAGAFFHPEMREFILPYDAVRTAASPDDVLLALLQSTYDAAAGLGGWDRQALECPIGVPGVVRALAAQRER